mgnify:FL=1|tara:strand:- start:656 stop:952 length:297 start_codon:yes stop_codon:yes gene_type:complete
MSNSFKHLQNKLQQFKRAVKPNEPERRNKANTYLQELTELVRDSYITESTSDYMFLMTLADATAESKYFGGFSKQAKDSLIIIEKRYNYIYEEGADIN